MGGEKSWFWCQHEGLTCVRPLRKRRRRASRTNRESCPLQRLAAIGGWCSVPWWTLPSGLSHSEEVQKAVLWGAARDWLQACLLQCSGPEFPTSVCWVCFPLSPPFLIHCPIQAFWVSPHLQYSFSWPHKQSKLLEILNFYHPNDSPETMICI